MCRSRRSAAPLLDHHVRSGDGRSQAREIGASRPRPRRLPDQAPGPQGREGIGGGQRGQARDRLAAHRHDHLSAVGDVSHVPAELVVQLAYAHLRSQLFAMWRHRIDRRRYICIRQGRSFERELRRGRLAAAAASHVRRGAPRLGCRRRGGRVLSDSVPPTLARTRLTAGTCILTATRPTGVPLLRLLRRRRLTAVALRRASGLSRLAHRLVAARSLPLAARRRGRRLARRRRLVRRHRRQRRDRQSGRHRRNDAVRGAQPGECEDDRENGGAECGDVAAAGRGGHRTLEAPGRHVSPPLV